MKTRIHNRLAAAVFAASLGLAATSALAGPDFFQQQMTQEVMKARQKLKEAEAAKGPERRKLMGEHMRMLHDTMQKCAAMKPKAGMSMQERDAWYGEHQKLMSQMMEQMMEEHRMMMDMGGMPMDMGDMHK